MQDGTRALKQVQISELYWTWKIRCKTCQNIQKKVSTKFLQEMLGFKLYFMLGVVAQWIIEALK